MRDPLPDPTDAGSRRLLGPFPRVVACMAVGCGCWALPLTFLVFAMKASPGPLVLACVPLAGAPLGLAAAFLSARPIAVVVWTNAIGFFLSMATLCILFLPLVNAQVIWALVATRPRAHAGARGH